MFIALAVVSIAGVLSVRCLGCTKDQ